MTKSRENMLCMCGAYRPSTGGYLYFGCGQNIVKVDITICTVCSYYLYELVIEVEKIVRAVMGDNPIFDMYRTGWRDGNVIISQPYPAKDVIKKLGYIPGRMRVMAFDDFIRPI